MTVHKSQGSEFDHVFFILPETLEGTSNTLQSRELVYTAVTRARQQLTIVTTPSIWHNAVQRVYQRRSSLPEQIKIIESTS
jgi:exodeoxyribonuclease V alpha subunit